MRISLQLLVPLASILVSFFVRTCDAVALEGAEAFFSFFISCFCWSFASALSSFLESTFCKERQSYKRTSQLSCAKNETMLTISSPLGLFHILSVLVSISLSLMNDAASLNMTGLLRSFLSFPLLLECTPFCLPSTKSGFKTVRSC